jgi:acetyl-CoA carboxylase biotin carboxyl carrier protein
MNPTLEDKFKELLAFAKEHGLSEVSWQEGDQKISFRRTPSNDEEVESEEPAPQKEPPVEEECVVTSPIVGIFRRSTAKNLPPLVMEGNHIKPGDRVGVVECMKIPTEVTTYCAGEIKKILVGDGQAVEYGQPLFIVTPFQSGETNGVSG